MPHQVGFIKAFTDDAPAITREFGQAERLMRLLYVTKLYLWPRYLMRMISRAASSQATTSLLTRNNNDNRFHQSVITALQNHQPEVIELHQPMSPLMINIQDSIIEIMKACVQELKSANQV